MRWIMYALIALSTLTACGPAPAPTPAAPALVSPVFIRFLTACSGVTITDVTSQAIAYGTCVGYARGFVDGHQVTIEGIRRSGNEESAYAARLWCVPPSTTNSVVMEVVVAWVNQHPQEYESIMGQFNGINAATAVIVKAMVTSVDFHKSKC